MAMVLGQMPDQDDKDEKVVAVHKTNITEEGAAYSYRVEEAYIEASDGSPVKTTKIRWRKRVYDVDVDAVIGVNRDGRTERDSVQLLVI